MFPNIIEKTVPNNILSEFQRIWEFFLKLKKNLNILSLIFHLPMRSRVFYCHSVNFQDIVFWFSVKNKIKYALLTQLVVIHSPEIKLRASRIFSTQTHNWKCSHGGPWRVSDKKNCQDLVSVDVTGWTSWMAWMSTSMPFGNKFTE